MGSAPLTESVGGSYTAAYTYGNDQLRRNGEYPQFDGGGSVTGETSSSQAVTYTQNTDSFGNQVGSSGSTSSSAKFSGDWGYQTDGDAGLIHVGARYYDPQVGSFATRDTMLDQIPYAYCGHDPVDRTDPDGHQYSDWEPWTWDFNFDHDDWQAIAGGVDQWGNGEAKAGAVILIPGAIGGFGRLAPGQTIPWLTPGWGSPTLIESPAGFFTPFMVPDPGIELCPKFGPVAAVGGGLLAGGAIAKGIAWLIRRFL